MKSFEVALKRIERLSMSNSYICNHFNGKGQTLFPKREGGRRLRPSTYSHAVVRL